MIIHMDKRTTLRINSSLIFKAKKLALSQGKSLTQLFEEAIGLYLLNANNKTLDKKNINLLSFKGQGLKAGINIEDNASLVDLMDDL